MPIEAGISSLGLRCVGLWFLGVHEPLLLLFEHGIDFVDQLIN
jgi:hypothetical protein